MRSTEAWGGSVERLTDRELQVAAETVTEVVRVGFEADVAQEPERQMPGRSVEPLRLATAMVADKPASEGSGNQRGRG
jgi:hypothetical protein